MKNFKGPPSRYEASESSKNRVEFLLSSGEKTPLSMEANKATVRSTRFQSDSSAGTGGIKGKERIRVEMSSILWDAISHKTDARRDNLRRIRS